MGKAELHAERPPAFVQALRNVCLEFFPGLALRRFELTPAELGRAGENFAARLLRGAGWRVLARRVHTPQGEVDLAIAGLGLVICVEVKTGYSEGWPRAGASLALTWQADRRPGRRLNWERIERQTRAGRWLAKRQPGGPWQSGGLDLVEVLVDRKRHSIGWVHHCNRLAPLGSMEGDPLEKNTLCSIHSPAVRRIQPAPP